MPISTKRFITKFIPAGSVPLCALLLLAFPPPAPAAKFAEYKVKAEFIVKMARFVDWPEGAFSGPQDPFVIAIAGEDPFGEYLKDIARTTAINGRGVVLRHVRSGEPLGACHLLFIAGSEYGRLPEILTSVGERAVLIVGDGDKFAKQGAHIGLYRKGGRLRFEINLAASRRSGLVVSSKLFRLAAAVYGGGGL